jgi:peptide/nickel transport system ATP-binding protein
MQLDVQDLDVLFPDPQGRLIPVVRGVSFSMGAQSVGIVGESGAGKSVTARAILRLLPPQAVLRAQRLDFDRTDLLGAREPVLRGLRGGGIALIPQDPKQALNPVMRIGTQIAETIRAHHGGSARAARRTALDLLEQMQLRDPARVARAYAHELSGGMAQRAMIAMMLAARPQLLIADEPTSALDAGVKAELLRLLRHLTTARGMGLLIISHDLPLVAHACERVLVMYQGRILEDLATAGLMRARHPYTRGLLACVPSLLQPRPRLPVLRREAWWAL